MFNETKILESFAGLIGWRQNPDPDGWQMTEGTSTETGLYYNDSHPLITPENLISSVPEFNLISADAAAVNNLFTEFVIQKTKSQIILGLNKWIQEKFHDGTINNIISQTVVYNQQRGYEYGEVVNGESAKLQGLEIEVNESRSLLMTIESVFVRLKKPAAGMIVYLFEAGKVDPINQTEPFDYVGNGIRQTVDITGWILEPGKRYLIGYQDQNYQSFNDGYKSNEIRAREYTVVGFTLDSSTATVADFGQVQTVYANNHGLSLDITLSCDYTDFLIKNKKQFAPFLVYFVGIDFMRLLAANPEARKNRNEDNVDQVSTTYEIEGDTRGDSSASLYAKMVDALAMIKFDGNGVDRICLKCKKRNGIRTRFVGPRR